MDVPVKGTATIPDPFDPKPITDALAALDARVKKLEGATPIPSPAVNPFGPTICFAPDSFWYKKLAPDAPLNQNSAKYVANVLKWLNVSGIKPLVDVLYPAAFTPIEYSPSVYVVTDPSVPKVAITITGNGSVVNIRIPASAVASVGGDAPSAFLDLVDNHYADFWQYDKANHRASWGGEIPQASNSTGIFAGGMGATATGLPHVGHLIKLSELKAGVIPHKIGIQMPFIPNYHVWPAQRHDSTAPYYPDVQPEGSIYRFPANIAIDPAWPPIIKMVVAAGRDYGFVQFDRAYSVCMGIENTAQFVTTTDPTKVGAEASALVDQFCGGFKHWDVALFKKLPMDKLQVLV